MNKILIPTDLSELGDFAYTIASKLAKDTGAEITVLSVVPGPQGAFYTMSGELNADDGSDYSEWEKRLEQTKKQLSEWASNKSDITNIIVTIGNVDKTILRISEQEDADLIVMGTDGENHNLMWTVASHTDFVTNHSEIPVLSLKCDRHNIDLNQIVLVGDFLVPEKINLSVLKSIQEVYQSKLILLKINIPSQVRSDEKIMADMEAFAKANNLTNYELHTYDDNTVESGVARFTATNDIDLIAIGTHQVHGFSKLFRGSVSDDIVSNLFHPILTFSL